MHRQAMRDPHSSGNLQEAQWMQAIKNAKFSEVHEVLCGEVFEPEG